jgi:hypothetical protein
VERHRGKVMRKKALKARKLDLLDR